MEDFATDQQVSGLKTLMTAQLMFSLSVVELILHFKYIAGRLFVLHSKREIDYRCLYFKIVTCLYYLRR